MTTIPPPSALAPLITTTASSTVTAVLTQLPSSLQSAGPGTIVTGTVVSVDNQGQIVLQTNAGLVSLQSAATVAAGQQVSLQIQSTGGGQAQAIVLSVEAAATAEAAALAAVADPSAAPQAAAPPATTIAPSVATGSVVIATVIGPGTAAPVPPAAMPAPPSPTPAQQTPASSGTPAASPSTSVPAQPPPMAPTAPRATTSAPSQLAPASTPAAAAPRATITAPTNVPVQSSNGAPSTSPMADLPVLPSMAPSQAPASSAAAEPANATAPSEPGTPAASAPAPATPAGSAPNSVVPTALADTSARPIAIAAARYAASLPQAGADNAPNLGASSPAGSAASLPMPPAGTQIPLRFVGPLPTLTAAAASASSGQLVATVVAVTPAGQVVIDTAIGRLALNASPVAENATGSQIAFEMAAPAMRPSSQASGGAFAAASSRGLAGLTTEWPALKTVLATLAEIDPRLAQQIVETALPRPDNPQFLGQILSLINSPADDVKMLLGQAAAAALQNAGRGDVMTSLNSDLQQMTRLNAAPSDWRVFYLPLFDSTEFRQLRVFTRRRRSGSDPRRDSGGRFVVEVEFEELGPLQLDGLVQKPRLDLILRTHVELPAGLQAGVTDVFSQTCDAAGLQGKIFFQAIPAFPVSPLDEMTSSSASGLTV